MAAKPRPVRNRHRTDPAVTSKVGFSLEERRAIIEEGVPIPMPSGIEVLVRPVTPDGLLRAGKVPDTLTPLVMEILYERNADKINNILDEFVKKPRESLEETLEMLGSLDVVARASLVNPDQVSLLTFTDRGFLFRLAFLPAEVLSRFRRKQAGNVDGVDQGEPLPQTA